ncbi:MAG: hypothetical protein ABI852_09905 [Gemmatimonadaceae bacterium]
MHSIQRSTIVAATTLIACAPTLTVARNVAAQQRMPSSGDPSHQVDLNTKDYDVSAEILWRALEAAYRAAGIRPTSLNSAGYQMAYVAAPSGPRVGNAKIESLVNCGGDKKAPLARTTPLRFAVRSEITPRGESSTLKTFVDVAPMAGLVDSATAPTCKSAFVLERKLMPQMRVEVRVVRVQR